MAPTNRLNTILAAIGLILAAISLAMVTMVYLSLPEQPEESIVANAKKLAGELADNNLPDAAIEEYNKILENEILGDSERGAINYMIGKLYFEDIGDYENAAAYYIRARIMDENGSYAVEAGKNLITCLERMGRRLDARRELDWQASANPDTTNSPEKLVAKVGSHDITLGDFNAAMQTLPPEMQEQVLTREGRRKFLDQVIGRELIYHAALREGLDRDSRMQKELKELEKEYLIQYYTRTKIAPTVKPDSAELRLYFDANKEKYGEKGFGKARDEVMQDYINYLGQKTINEYIGALLEAEPVQVFEENLK
jgi:tetratricopeptide (TPR) repeat protein